MIEVIYKEEGQNMSEAAEEFSIPRNIRQIGFTDGNYRIYIEDYVYTFLGKMAEAAKEEESCLAVLTGEMRWNEGLNYLFIKGALLTDGNDAAEDHIDFTEEMWNKIQEEQKNYFPEQEIVGWFFARQQLPMKASEILLKAHLRFFGADKILMLMEPSEREDAFFCYENNFLEKQKGYYIYYEKNTAMRDYMVEKEPEQTQMPKETVEDEAVRIFRKIIKNKKEPTEKEAEKTEGHTSVFSYAATACLVLAVLATGAGLYRNYRSFQEMYPESDPASAVISEKNELPQADKSTQSEAAEFSKKDQEESEKADPDTQKKEEKPAREQEAEASSGERIERVVEQADRESRNLSRERNRDARKKTGENQDESAWAASANAAQQQKNILDMHQEADERKKEEQGEESEAASAQAAGSSYVIRPGDTIYEISMARYGSLDAVSEICRLNGLSENETIYPGQVLVLP